MYQKQIHDTGAFTASASEAGTRSVWAKVREKITIAQATMTTNSTKTLLYPTAAGNTKGFKPGPWANVSMIRLAMAAPSVPDIKKVRLYIPMPNPIWSRGRIMETVLAREDWTMEKPE